MGILDKFKRKSGAKHVLPKKSDKKSDKVKVEKRQDAVGASHDLPKKTIMQKNRSVKKIKSHEAAEIYKIIKSHHIHEHAGDLVKENKYVFKIWKNANKIQVKKAIEKLYDVKVKKINIINVPRKKRRIGQVQGWRSGYKKAVATLSKGKIEIG